MEFSRPEYRSGQPFPSPGDLPNPRIEPRSPKLQADSLPAEPQGKSKNTDRVAYSLLKWIFQAQELNWSTCIASGPTKQRGKPWQLRDSLFTFWVCGISEALLRQKHHCYIYVYFLMFLYIYLNILISKIIFNWRIIAFHYDVGLCHHQYESAIGMYMSPPSWMSLPSPSPCHPSRSSLSSELGQAELPVLTAASHQHGRVYASVLMSPPPHPHVLNLLPNPTHPTPLGCHRALDRSSLHHTANFHWLSNFIHDNVQIGFPGGASGKEPACQCRTHQRHGFDPWVGKIP